MVYTISVKGRVYVIKKIAIIGSCITRDNFNSQFNPNYKMFFNCVLHQHQASILSLMSKQIPYNEEETVGMRDFDKWHLRTEHSKEFLTFLKERNPEYLLIDFYGDVYCGVVELDNDNYFTYNPKFLKISTLKNKKVMRVEDDVDKYLNIWKRKADKLFSIIKESVPQCKILVVKSRFEEEFKEGDNLNEIRKKNGIRTINKNLLNNIWNQMTDYLVDNHQVQVLDMTDKRYLLNKNHPWGQFYVHYTMDFYQDFFNKLQAKVLKDSIEELAKEKNRASLTSEGLSGAKSDIDSLKMENVKLKKRVNFFENETFTHAVKRYLLKIKVVNKLNDTVKGR